MTSATRTALLLVFILGSIARPGDAQAPSRLAASSPTRGRIIAGASVTLNDERGGVQGSTSTNRDGRTGWSPPTLARRP